MAQGNLVTHAIRVQIPPLLAPQNNQLRWTEPSFLCLNRALSETQQLGMCPVMRFHLKEWIQSVQGPLRSNAHNILSKLCHVWSS